MPGGMPRYVRVYDNGGKTFDRYTVVYTGRAAVDRTGVVAQWPYVGMSEFPFSPQGVGQHGFSEHRQCDLNKHGWPKQIGSTCHLGKRIEFIKLPKDCRDLVMADYKAIWKLK